MYILFEEREIKTKRMQNAGN
uniref:Uncharacterized protein n=1 Tax=Arundo donax TaxID=35708 RepID=A0A0A8ZAL9_ARUDO